MLKSASVHRRWCCCRCRSLWSSTPRKGTFVSTDSMFSLHHADDAALLTQALFTQWHNMCDFIPWMLSLVLLWRFNTRQFYSTTCTLFCRIRWGPYFCATFFFFNRTNPCCDRCPIVNSYKSDPVWSHYINKLRDMLKLMSVVKWYSYTLHKFKLFYHFFWWNSLLNSQGMFSERFGPFPIGLCWSCWRGDFLLSLSICRLHWNWFFFFI